MFNQLFISQRMYAPFIKMKTAALLLLVFAMVWIFTACNQQPASAIKPSVAAEVLHILKQSPRNILILAKCCLKSVKMQELCRGYPQIVFGVIGMTDAYHKEQLLIYCKF